MTGAVGPRGAALGLHEQCRGAGAADAAGTAPVANGRRRVLMPLSFATMLGGLVTLIGTPPNIIIATYRADVSGDGLRHVRLCLCRAADRGVMGLLFVLLIGWRLLPSGPDEPAVGGRDVRTRQLCGRGAGLNEDSEYVGRTVHELEGLDEERTIVVGLLRDEARRLVRIAQ